MLNSLHIVNYAIIDELRIDFHKGLHIVTGETGAGKSIILGALGLILGKRADTSVLKVSNEKCTVEAEFDISNYSLEEFFAAKELDYEKQTLIRREITAAGKSRAFINDTPVTLPVLQELSLHLIDIHSQHQNLELGNQEFLLSIIDNYAATRSALEKYRDIFQCYTEEKISYEKLRRKTENTQAEIDFLQHQFNELTVANLADGELPELEEELNQIEHAEEIKSNLHQASILLSGDDMGLVQQLNAVRQSFEKIKNVFHPAQGFFERTESLYIEAKDLELELGQAFEKVEFNPERQEFVSQRLSLLYNLMQKHKTDSIGALIEKRDQLDAQLNEYLNRDFNLEEQKKKFEKVKSELEAFATELSSKRQKSFGPFAQKVTSLLVGLGMPHAKLDIHHEILEPGETGIDQIRFLFSANQHQTPKDISKIASGGELSRLMLAVKYLICNSTNLPTIIFDEIDTGVSGDIADKVGQIVVDMAKGMQVINITHLPQVASKGDYHFLVYKTTDTTDTRTGVKLLSAEERVEEIAKMLSGEQITTAAYENARVLLNR